MKYGELNLGQVEAVVNKLGGMDGVRRFLSGELVVKATEYVVWKRLAIGTVGSAEKYRQALKSGGFCISDWASDILKKMHVATEAQELDLVLVSVTELGFTGVTRYEDICRRAKERGLNLCPAEVGPALRLSYTDQPMNEWLTVAMEPLTGSGGFLFVFRVVHGKDGRWLNTRYGEPVRGWDPESRFVFVRPA